MVDELQMSEVGAEDSEQISSNFMTMHMISRLLVLMILQYESSGHNA